MLDERRPTRGSADRPGIPTHPQTLDQVRYSWIADVPEHYAVCGFEGVEELNHPYELLVRLSTDDEMAEPEAMLGTNVQLHIERSDVHLRYFCGLVRRVSATQLTHGRRSVVVQVVPALRALELT